MNTTMGKDGSPVSGWLQHTNSSVKGAPALTSLDDDAALEIVAGDLSGTLFTWNGDGLLARQQVILPLQPAAR